MRGDVKTRASSSSFSSWIAPYYDDVNKNSPCLLSPSYMTLFPVSLIVYSPGLGLQLSVEYNSFTVARFKREDHIVRSSLPF